jgi:RecA-family ATPase
VAVWIATAFTGRVEMKQEMENSMEMLPKSDIIKQFITQITKNWNEIGQPLIEIRSISLSGSTNAARFKLKDLDKAVEHAEAMNKAKANIYMCINAIDPIRAEDIPAGKAAKDTDIAAAFYCFADADTKGAMENIMSFAGPKFTMSVKTGTKPFSRGHAYWELEEPCKNMDAWKEVQKSIAASLQTDAAVINPSRIMRVAGTVSWPNKKKQDKGYVPELVTMRTEFTNDRDPQPFERLMRAFPKKELPNNQVGGIEIDLGQQAMDRQLAAQSIMAGDDWHNNIIRLVASYVSKGLSDEEIHAITDSFTMSGYSVDDTRQEVQQAIDGARDKGWTPPPDPAKERMQQQNQALNIALEPSESPTEDATEQNWPTPYEMFDALTLPRREWVYGYDYIKKYISVTASAGGIGKTSAIIVEALAIATGKDLLGTPVKEQANVWIINLEDPISEMQMRTIAAMQHYNLKPDDIKGRLFIDGEDTMQITLAAEGRDGLITNNDMLAAMIRVIKQNKIGVVILDPFVSAHLVNENNNGSIQAVVAMLRKLARDTNSSVQLVHHIRKTNGEDATIDSVRGAGSLIGAARAARVINRITPDDAIALGVDEHEALGIFAVDDGKANLAPPSDKRIYRRMQSVEIANGEHIGVATEFKLPDMFDGVTANDLREVQKKVAEAERNKDPYRADIRADDWIGNLIAEQLNLDLDKPKDKAKVKTIVTAWIKSNSLKIEQVPSTRLGRDVKAVIVGDMVNWDEI